MGAGEQPGRELHLPVPERLPEIERARDPLFAGPERQLDEATRQKFGIAESVQGVVVTAVAANSAAAERRIEAGDVIVEIGQEAVSSPDAVVSRIDKLRSEDRRNALMMIADKTGALRFVTVRME